MMSISISVDDVRIACSQIGFSRGIGLRQIWTFSTLLENNAGNQATQKQLATSVAKPVVGVFVDDEEVAGGLTLIGGGTSSHQGEFFVDFFAESYPLDTDLLFQPNARVFNNASLLEIMESIKAIFPFDVHANLRDPFARVKLPFEQRVQLLRLGIAAEHVCSIQTGTSLDFVQKLLGLYWQSCSAGITNRTDGRLGIVATNSEDQRGRLTIVPLDRDGFSTGPEFVDDLFTNGDWRFGLCSDTDDKFALPGMDSRFHQGRFAEYVRPFASETWKTLLTHEVPASCSTDGLEIFAHRAIETLSSYAHTDGATWSTRLCEWTSPQPFNSRSSQTQSWLGVGIVTSEVEIDEQTGPWITVELNGVDGESTRKVRWQTPYSGTEGTTGLILYPKPETLVGVVWSGIFGDPLIATGNVRHYPTQVPHPAMVFEETDSLMLQAMGNLTTDVKGKQSVTSGKGLEVISKEEGILLAGQGVQMEMKDSKVNVK